MNSKDFIQTLRKVIREEVQTAVRTELSKLERVITESKSQQQKQRPLNYTDSIKTTAQKTVKKFSNNPLLNEILNETGMLPGELDMSSLNENINYNDYSEWPTMNVSNNYRNPVVPERLTDVNGNIVDTAQLARTEAGAAVINAMTKDYSAILKAAQAKSKIGR